MSVIEINGLTKLYKNGRGVRGVNLTVEKGEIVGLLGQNGSGKTTVMKVLLGLTRPNDGRMNVFGRDYSEFFEQNMEKIGSLVEAPAIYKDLSAYKHLKMCASCYGNVSRERIDSVLDMVRLLRYKNDSAGRFSLGMKQRLGLAMALLHQPELMILDEPVNGLDIEGVVEMRELILSLNREYGTTFLISSHMSSEIEKTCTKVAVMHEGELVATETTENILRSYPSVEEYFLTVIREKRGGVCRE